MKILSAIIQKEFIQVFRDRLLSKIIFLMPIAQLVILVYAANFEIKSMSLAFVDQDHSTTTRDIYNTIDASSYFRLYPVDSYAEAMKGFESDKYDAIIALPANFEKSIGKGEKSQILVSVNAINSMKAGVASSYLGKKKKKY